VALAPHGYSILSEIGEGGMGVVYRAHDAALNRPVALKCLRPRFANDEAVTARFLHEASVTARLQHPGVPPVHAVGRLDDGRPFLAMKLVLGRTLDALLSEQGPGAGRWLAVFESICQAVGYAHSQGVIHRDLKPLNVMVGAFGEVQVMDWGLAKSLTGEAGPSATDDPLAMTPESGPAPTPGFQATRAGSVLGTPAFMPPEQAIGAIDKVDRRSDVFGLGAILCCLLTGEPPFVGVDGESTRQLAARAKLDDAFSRLDGCGAEPDLIVLAKRCLAAEQADRPAEAGVLAAEVASLRRRAEERARLAEIEAVRHTVQAQERARQAAQEVERSRRNRAAGVIVAAILALPFLYFYFFSGHNPLSRPRGGSIDSRTLTPLHEVKLPSDRQIREAALWMRARKRLDAGQYDEAVKVCEELYSETRTLPSLSMLAWMYYLAGRLADAERAQRQWLASAKGEDGAGSADFVRGLARLGLYLLAREKWAEAEASLRECLALAGETSPEAWTTFDAKSKIGAALLGQKKYADAEPLLLAGYNGLKKREKSIPPQGRPRLAEAADRLIELYTATGEARRGQEVAGRACQRRQER
jgi:serine/threonine protein kinase